MRRTYRRFGLLSVAITLLYVASALIGCLFVSDNPMTLRTSVNDADVAGFPKLSGGRLREIRYGFQVQQETENVLTLKHYTGADVNTSADEERYDDYLEGLNHRETFSTSQKIPVQENSLKSQYYHTDDEISPSLGLLSSRSSTQWTRLPCNKSASFRLVKLPTKLGTLSMYVYDSMMADLSITSWALKGQIPEKEEIEQFLELSKDLPLIDVGGNLGTVALQAAMQKRQVVALEPVYSNAQRLCRSALDFGLDPFLHVLVNAASASEGEVTLAMDYFREMARFSVQGMPGKEPGYDPVTSYAILLDRLLEVVPFQQAALKIDVEAHEGYVLAGSRRLFQEMHIPLVWLEWEHVKQLPIYGARFILGFMREHSMEAYDVMSGEKLLESEVRDWPPTVLWKKMSG